MNQLPVATPVQKPRVLFVCAGNTCRSVLAEYIAKRKYGKLFDAASAGLRPGTVDDAESAISTLKDLLGVDASAHEPRDVREVDIKSFEVIVAMTSRISVERRAAFPELPAERVVKWQISDPFGDDLAQYSRCAKAIHKAMTKLSVVAAQA